jgi:membrane-associated phospholipid phosphatase
MNTPYGISVLIAALTLALGLGTLTQTQAQTLVELKAGTWRTLVLGSAEQIAVQPPPDEAASRQETIELMVMSEGLSDEARARIAYWDAGAPNYRWNQLATKHGLESDLLLHNHRLITYLNVAIYDAMVAAEAAKELYHRPRPSVLEPTLQTVLPTPVSASYPSQHAVAAGAAEVVLHYFFPERAETFSALAEEAAQAHVLAGLQYPSDAEAGLELGRQVGALVVERAKNDNSDAVWRGERPSGPGIFALDSLGDEMVGAWKPWLLTSGSEVRPPPPPAHDSPERAAEIAELRDYQHQRDSNPFMELFFWPEDPAGRPEPGSAPLQSSQVAFYYAPFNHLLWLAELNQKVFEYRLDRDLLLAARAYALVSIAFYDATVAVWDGRFAYWVARPDEFDPELTTVLTTYPNPEYPSGHTGIATATSEVLAYLFPDDAHYFRSRAAELGESRIWAGIHFRSAVEAGAELGRKVAAKAIVWAEQEESGQETAR